MTTGVKSESAYNNCIDECVDERMSQVCRSEANMCDKLDVVKSFIA